MVRCTYYVHGMDLRKKKKNWSCSIHGCHWFSYARYEPRNFETNWITGDKNSFIKMIPFALFSQQPVSSFRWRGAAKEVPRDSWSWGCWLSLPSSTSWRHTEWTHAKLNGCSILTRTTTINFGTGRWSSDTATSRIGAQFGQRNLFVQNESIAFLHVVCVQRFVGPFHFFGSGMLDQNLIAVVEFHILYWYVEPLIQKTFKLSHGLIQIDDFFSYIVVFVTYFHLKMERI